MTTLRAPDPPRCEQGAEKGIAATLDDFDGVVIQAQRQRYVRPCDQYDGHSVEDTLTVSAGDEASALAAVHGRLVHDGWRTVVPSKEFNGRGATLWAWKHGVPTMVTVSLDDETEQLKIIAYETSEEDLPARP